MWGYVKQHGSYVYAGNYKAGVELENARFVEVVNGEVKPLAAANSSLKMVVVEKRVENGLPMVGAIVIGEADTGVYFNHTICENPDEVSQFGWKVPAGHYVRMIQPVKTTEIYMDVTQAVYDSLKIGDAVKAGANGVLVKG